MEKRLGGYEICCGLVDFNENKHRIYQPLKEGHFTYCPHCGHQVDPTDKFCSHCGSPLDETSDDPILPVETPVIVHDRVAHVLGILSIVLGICSSGILGIILGIIGLTNAKTADNKALNIVGIIISVILLFLGSLIAAGISGK